MGRLENRSMPVDIGLAEQEYLLLQLYRVQILVTWQRRLALERAQHRGRMLTVLKLMQNAQSFQTHQQIAACTEAVEQCRQHVARGALPVARAQRGQCLTAVMQ